MALATVTTTPSAQAKEIAQRQQSFFNTGVTLEYRFRQKQLKILLALIKKNEAALLKALADDLGKPNFEAFSSEISFLYEEIKYTLRHLKSWMQPERVNSPLFTWPSKSFIKHCPVGTTLIIAPWNYPVNLAFAPAIAAIAAGNTVLLKPAEQTPHTSLLIEQMVSQAFKSQYFAIVQGPGSHVIPPLVKGHRFGHLFFTGSVPVGRKIAELTAPHLISTTLELGGKSPAVIDGSAKLKVAARRIAFGKWLNAGQTCVAPDYLLVQRSVKDDFVKYLKQALTQFYPQGALKSPDYSALISLNHLQTVKDYLKDGTIIYGGKIDEDNLKLEPTLLDKVSLNSAVMKNEIFGPILPIITFDMPDEALEIISQNPNPLAFYLFSEDKNIQRTFTEKLSFGGGAINNAILQLGNPRLPFGGVGNSGIGNYHGLAGFKTFSHTKSILKTATWFDLKQKYPPYSNLAYKAVKYIMG